MDGGEDKRGSGEVPCSGREGCCWFRQGIARFEYICMCLSNSYLQALEDKEERGDATVIFGQMRGKGAGVIKGVVW
jgi:hypothetical protein